MKIDSNNPLSGLKKLISKLFAVDFTGFTFPEINQNLPQALQEIYTIDAFFAAKDCGYETLRFFRNMDRLVLYQDLKTEDEQFNFAVENQGNWYAKTSLNTSAVYIYNHEELEDGSILNENTDEFLTTFALLEISNNFKYFCGLYENSVEEIKKEFRKSQEIWTEKKYLLREVSFYLIDDEVFFDQANMTLATNNEEKFNYYRSKFETYLYH